MPLRFPRFPRRHTTPDDERSRSPGLYVLVGLASLGMLALALATLVVPPALAAHLVIRGGRSESLLLKLLGLGVLALWFGFLYLAGRRMMGAQVRPDEDEGSGGDNGSD